MKMSYSKLLLCPSNSQSAAGPFSEFQNSSTLSFGFCLRERKRKRSKVLFRFTTKFCPHHLHSSGKCMTAIWMAGNLCNNVFPAACPIERKKILITFLLAAFSLKLHIRTHTRSLPSVRVNSVSKMECFAIMATVNSSIHFFHSIGGCS